MWTRIKTWAWIALGYVVAAAVGAAMLAGVLFGRRREVTPEDRDDERDLDVVRETGLALEERAAGHAEHARARAESAEWDAARGEAERLRVSTLNPEDRARELEAIRARLRARDKLRNGILTLAILVLPMSARADEPMAHPQTGEAGYWVADAQHAEDAGWLAELEYCRSSVEGYRASTAITLRATHYVTAAQELSRGALTASERMREVQSAELDAAHAWYRSPKLWAAVGLLGGSVLTLAVVWGVQ